MEIHKIKDILREAGFNDLVNDNEFFLREIMPYVKLKQREVHKELLNRIKELGYVDLYNLLHNEKKQKEVTENE